MRYAIIIFSILLTIILNSCKKRNPTSISKKEYNHKKSDGFWNIRNKKAVSYNQRIAKPKRDKQTKKLAAENRRIAKQNSKQKKKFSDNEELLKTFDHH